jgi:hypothetical protein
VRRARAGRTAGRAAGRHRTVACPACERRWPSPTSRWCGWCGTPLGTAAPPPPSGRGAARLRLGVLAAAGALTVAAVGAQLATFVGPGSGGGDPEIALPGPSGLVPSGGLSAEEAEAAIAPFDDARLRCEPDGCERWRLDLPQGSVGEARRLGDLLVLHRDGRLQALDLWTGEQRWTTPLDVRGDGPSRRGLHEPRMIATGASHIVVARQSGDLHVIDQHGRSTWSGQLPEPSWIWDVHVVGDVVVTHGPPPSPSDGTTMLHAYSLVHGVPRWSKAVDELLYSEGSPFAPPSARDLLARIDGDIVRLDPSDGEVLVTFGDAAWATRAGARMLALWDDTEHVTRLVDERTGEQLQVVEGTVETAMTASDGTTYLLVTSYDTVQRELVAVGDDDQLRWRRPVLRDRRDRCCLALLETQDGAIYVHQPPMDGQVVHPDDGSDLPRRDPPPIPAGEWWTGSIAVHHLDGGYSLRSTDGAASVLSTDSWLLLDDPVVIGSSRGLLAIDLVAPPVGGRPPTRLPAR